MGRFLVGRLAVLRRWWFAAVERRSRAVVWRLEELGCSRRLVVMRLAGLGSWRVPAVERRSRAVVRRLEKLGRSRCEP